MYLDYAASTPLLDEVKNRLISSLDIYGNPSSQHYKGIEAKECINDASELIAQKINCNPSEVHYTSGATMANNIAIQGFFRSNPNGILITSKLEHDDILLMTSWLSCHNYNVKFVTNNRDGLIDTSVLYQMLEEIRKVTNIPVLVSIQAANSESGVIQMIDGIGAICHNFENVYFHTDATQFIPYFPIDVQKSCVDMLSMSGQKIGCIKGTGLLYVKENTPISPIVFGEQGLIGGTENTLGIICLGEAFKCLDYNSGANSVNVRNHMIKKLPGKLIGSNIYRLPNNIYMIFPGIRSEVMIQLLSDQNIYVSGGSACSSLSDEPSHVVLAMGYSEDDANCCIRFTLPPYLTMDEADEICRIVNDCYDLLKG